MLHVSCCTFVLLLKFHQKFHKHTSAGLAVLRTGRPPTEAQNPQPPKVLGRVLGEVPARNGVLGEVLGKVLVLLCS